MNADYEPLRKKYNLPAFDVLNNELDLTGCEEAENYLRGVMKRIGDRLEFFSEVIGNLLQPDSHPSNLYELNAFSDQEREKLPAVYKKMMFLHREYLEEELNFNEDNCASFILHFLKEWEIVKKDLTNVLAVMKQSWQGESKLRSDSVYYG